MALVRLWLFRMLVLAAAAVILVSAFMPWWTTEFDFTAWEERGILPPSGITEFTVTLYQHGIPDNYAREYFQADITPAYQVTLAWVYIGVTVSLVSLSAFLKGKKGRWLLGITGLVYIIYAAVALMLIIERTGFYDIPLQGTQLGEQDYYLITTGFHPGYYLAYASGFVCLILALFRNRILGRIEAKT